MPGFPTRLLALRFRCEWLVFTALGMQLVVVVPVVPGLPSQEQLALRAGSYVAVAAFLALNVRLRRPSPAAEVIFEPAPAPVVTPPPPAIAGQWPAASPPAVAVLNEALPPLMVNVDGARRWIADVVDAGPLVVVVSVEPRDARRDALMAAVRKAGVRVILVSRSPAAVQMFGAPAGGVFVIDCGCRLRLAFAAARPGEWIAPATVISRVRRLAPGDGGLRAGPPGSPLPSSQTNRGRWSHPRTG